MVCGVPNKIWGDASDRPCKRSEHRYTPPHRSGDETFFIFLRAFEEDQKLFSNALINLFEAR
ncbi:hypothetical protein CEE69_00875 [Rhodopirellula bahusiensis]|uniref:Uncharacterized protein n=1 Tax=Rhodopirellula bahusiensis TaxID=2014065 RepID=A0A2G1WD43_9BACT|nr:hypothetical protein CEE69_00875 [Rhodopirellula bahusiensis]